VTSAAATKTGRRNRGLRKIDRLKTGLHNKNHPTTARREIAPLATVPQITDRPEIVPPGIVLLETGLPEIVRQGIDRLATGPLGMETAPEPDRHALDSQDGPPSQVDPEGRIDRPSCRPTGQSRRTL